MATVTISASYGARGEQIAQGVAERLGLAFLDRAIPLRAARQLHLPEELRREHRRTRTDAMGPVCQRTLGGRSREHRGWRRSRTCRGSRRLSNRHRDDSPVGRRQHGRGDPWSRGNGCARRQTRRPLRAPRWAGGSANRASGCRRCRPRHRPRCSAGCRRRAGSLRSILLQAAAGLTRVSTT